MSRLDPIVQLIQKVEDMDRRMRRMIVHGTITDVDHKKGLVRLDDGMGTEEGEDGKKENKTDWLPWAEHAGKIKTRTMPSVGQSVVCMSPSGDMAQGIVRKGWYNENNKMPKAEGGEYTFINGTSHKQTISNGPEDKTKGGDGSESTAGQQASPAEKEKKNQHAKNNVHQTFHGALEDDEGSWGDGDKNVTKVDRSRKAYTEHSVGDDGHTHYAEDKDGNASTRSSTATNVTHDIKSPTKPASIGNKVADTSGTSVKGQSGGSIDHNVNGATYQHTGDHFDNTVGASNHFMESAGSYITNGGQIHTVQGDAIRHIGVTHMDLGGKKDTSTPKILTTAGPMKKSDGIPA
jgi:hypothetical protein